MSLPTTDVVIGVHRLAGGAVPVYATAGAAACDVYANEAGIVPARGIKLFRTGLVMVIPDGFECQVRPRSGLAVKHGITVINSPGTIDSDYRGELGIALHNTSTVDFEVNIGDRIAQLVFAPAVRVRFEDVDIIPPTCRGSGGYGSTGR